MLSRDTVTLLAEAISHLGQKHQAELGNAVREFKFKMMKQGTSQSSMFNQGKAKIYYEAFEKYADSVWEEMRRVLEEIGFDSQPGCENELVSMLVSFLSGAYEADKMSLSSLEAFGVHMPETAFEFHYQAVVKRLVTKIKIFSQKVRTMREKEKAQATTQNNYYLHGPNSRVNIGSTDNSINIITEPQLFSKLREAVEAQVSDSNTKARLLEKIKEGEALPKKSPVFNNWFTQFLALTADCITVIQPFVPALVQLLAQATV